MSALFVLGMMIGFVLVHESSGRAMLGNWAKNEGHEIIQQERRHWFARGPFTWRTSQYQPVYRVIVRDRDHRNRMGWVRCGHFWFGLLVDQVEVRWDGEAATQSLKSPTSVPRDVESSVWDREFDS